VTDIARQSSRGRPKGSKNRLREQITDEERAKNRRAGDRYRAKHGLVVVNGKGKRALNCVVCGSPFLANKGAKVCSSRCAGLRGYAAAKLNAHVCVVCGASFQSRQQKAATCSPNCCSQLRAENARRIAAENQWPPRKWSSHAARFAFYGARRHARIRAFGWEDIDPLVVFARDGWTCQLCHEPVDRSIRWPHPMSVSIDHVTPLAAGGVHASYNVQCAHLGCNSRKNSREEPAWKLSSAASRP
jgi:predicted nucleic acid-binding Zn ribbon protein